ncbi:hypothetical protein D3C87_2119860 [compost metagenome]
MFEEPTKLPRAEAGVEVFFNIQHPEVLKDYGQCAVKTGIVVETDAGCQMQEVVVEPAFYFCHR